LSLVRAFPLRAHRAHKADALAQNGADQRLIFTIIDEAFAQIVAYEKGEELRLANPEVRARR
jgi:hypothetical protein